MRLWAYITINLYNRIGKCIRFGSAFINTPKRDYCEPQRSDNCRARSPALRGSPGRCSLFTDSPPRSPGRVYGKKSSARNAFKSPGRLSRRLQKKESYKNGSHKAFYSYPSTLENFFNFSSSMEVFPGNMLDPFCIAQTFPGIRIVFPDFSGLSKLFRSVPGGQAPSAPAEEKDEHDKYSDRLSRAG